MCNAHTLFCLPYAESLIDWRLDSKDLAPTRTLESPGGKVSDGVLQVYADDVFERRVVVSGEAEEAVDIIRGSDVAFDESMGKRGYCQNISTRAVALEVRSHSRRLQSLITDGKVEASTRHLGANTAELGAMLARSRSGFLKSLHRKHPGGGAFWADELRAHE